MTNDILNHPDPSFSGWFSSHLNRFCLKEKSQIYYGVVSDLTASNNPTSAPRPTNYYPGYKVTALIDANINAISNTGPAIITLRSVGMNYFII